MGAALIVNPMSREDVAEAIRKGLAMPLDERRSRWRELAQEVEGHDVTAWRDAFVDALRRPQPSRAAARGQPRAETAAGRG
jgi:trehalose 6-phosphate synthase